MMTQDTAEFDEWCRSRDWYLNDSDDGAKAARLCARQAWAEGARRASTNREPAPERVTPQDIDRLERTVATIHKIDADMKAAREKFPSGAPVAAALREALQALDAVQWPDDEPGAEQVYLARKAVAKDALVRAVRAALAGETP